jgi:uncharacterized protein (TIGR02147 family)
MNDVFQEDDYKGYVKKALAIKGHGSRLKLSEAINCHSAYITQVLNKDAHFNIEQALEASNFFNHTREEEEFFLLLLQYAKAGTKKLRDLSWRKIQEIRESRALVSNRIKGKEELDVLTQAKYYSRWYYSAIHVLVTIPGKKSKTSIASYLGLEMDIVNEAIEFLESCGLITSGQDGYETGKTKLFLKGDSPFIVQHHQNWRLSAMNDILKPGKENLHFSSVYTLSEKDFIRIREQLLENIQEVWSIVQPSKEEKLCALNIDFFELGRS